ncbi:unnamed protein product [Pleuronectes platessa]|uniref:Uncharacterized protein n=1 Tax=Pleuronectes platessa TaxID=8262 RepID=A0A9N7YAX8_PLEPL|nr:unnamed protein product [Pleuronectes platessa]
MDLSFVLPPCREREKETEETERGRRGEAAGKRAATAEVLPAVCAPLLERHCIILPPPLFSPLSSPHPTSREPEGYRQRAKHRAPTPLLFCHPVSSLTFLSSPHFDVLSSPS